MDDLFGPVTKTLLPNRSAWFIEYGPYDAYAVDQGGEFLLCREAKGIRPHPAAEHARLATGSLREVMAQLVAWADDGARARHDIWVPQPWFVRHRTDKKAALSGFPCGRATAFASQEAAADAIIYHELDPDAVELVTVEPDTESWPRGRGE